LAGRVGRSRYADRLRLNFFRSREILFSQPLNPVCVFQADIKKSTAGLSPAIAQFED
jgi:hypothetical protein